MMFHSHRSKACKLKLCTSCINSWILCKSRSTLCVFVNANHSFPFFLKPVLRVFNINWSFGYTKNFIYRKWNYPIHAILSTKKKVLLCSPERRKMARMKEKNTQKMMMKVKRWKKKLNLHFILSINSIMIFDIKHFTPFIYDSCNL